MFTVDKQLHGILCNEKPYSHIKKKSLQKDIVPFEAQPLV